MSDNSGPRVGARMLLWGRGLDALPPGRRLAWDAAGLTISLALLVALAVVLDFEPDFAVAYITAWVVFTVAFSAYRYVKATKRGAANSRG
jgi:hypothetical protein